MLEIGFECRADGVQLRPPHEGYGGPAEAAASHARADDAPVHADAPGGIHEAIEFGAADGVVVREGIVAGVHGLAERGPVAGFEGGCGGAGAGDFRDDVARALVVDGARAIARGFQDFGCNTPPGGCAQCFQRFRALCAPGGVFAIGEGVDTPVLVTSTTTSDPRGCGVFRG